MQSNYFSSIISRGMVFLSLIIVILIFSSPAQATNGCYKSITFKNASGYIANATVRYQLDGRDMSQKTDNFPARQDKRIPIPCNATSVHVSAHAVGGHDILSQDLGNAQDRCFRLKGTTLNTHYESCDPPGTPPIEVSNCYKHITIKNQGGYVAEANVKYTFNHLSSNHPTGHFPAGQSKKVPVPCDATTVIVTANVVDPLFESRIFSDWLHKTEDRCYALKGTFLHYRYESCDQPKTPSYVIDCWKHITLKNQSAYVMNAIVSYTVRKNGVTLDKPVVNTGNFPVGQGKRIPVPCDVSPHIEAKVVGAIQDDIIPYSRRNLEKNQDHCFIFRGTTGNPRYEPCVKEPAAEVEQKHTITIRNHGAYATELTVNYDLNYQRKTSKKVIQTQQEGGLSIPLEAKNVQVTAKAIGGKQIFEQIFETAQSYCREVKGTTLFPKHAPCI